MKSFSSFVEVSDCRRMQSRLPQQNKVFVLQCCSLYTPEVSSRLYPQQTSTSNWAAFSHYRWYAKPCFNEQRQLKLILSVCFMFCDSRTWFDRNPRCIFSCINFLCMSCTWVRHSFSSYYQVLVACFDLTTITGRHLADPWLSNRQEPNGGGVYAAAWSCAVLLLCCFSPDGYRGCHVSQLGGNVSVCETPELLSRSEDATKILTDSD